MQAPMVYRVDVASASLAGPGNPSRLARYGRKLIERSNVSKVPSLGRRSQLGLKLRTNCETVISVKE